MNAKKSNKPKKIIRPIEYGSAVQQTAVLPVEETVRDSGGHLLTS